YKSAFRTLYSLFDKIAYFINRFFDLNETLHDHKISFDSIFRELKGGKKWKPHRKLKNSKNYYIHALFYILKDIRDVKDATPVSRWLDPDAKALSDIRNAIEHRSLKIIDDFGYTIIWSDCDYRQTELTKIDTQITDLESQLQDLYKEIRAAKESKNDDVIVILEVKEQQMDKQLCRLKAKIYEKKKLSSHSLLIKESEFESRLMTLMKLARNSIMYLSLAIHLEEKIKSDDGALKIHKEVPLK
ncbi:MAG: hypothetical protein JKX76_02600, partial [Colwellia sp.]|nr:hypothetical protein [Colwellia sp.]